LQTSQLLMAFLLLEDIPAENGVPDVAGIPAIFNEALPAFTVDFCCYVILLLPTSLLLLHPQCC
jgi:hypothetical protein